MLTLTNLILAVLLVNAVTFGITELRNYRDSLLNTPISKPPPRLPITANYTAHNQMFTAAMVKALV